MTQLAEDGLVGAQEQVVDAEACEFAFPFFALDEGAASVADEATTGFGFAASEDASAFDVQLGRILEMQHEAIMLLRHHL